MRDNQARARERSRVMRLGEIARAFFSGIVLLSSHAFQNPIGRGRPVQRAVW